LIEAFSGVIDGRAKLHPLDTPSNRDNPATSKQHTRRILAFSWALGPIVPALVSNQKA